MRFLALALFFGAAVSCCLADDADELIQLAEAAGAPFTQTSLWRLQDSGLWGAKRAARTTDVAIINASGISFKLVPKSCFLGRYSTDLLPEDHLQQNSSTVFGMENSKDLEGVRCGTRYESQDGSYIYALINNEYFEGNAYYVSTSFNLKVSATFRYGHNNQARFVVYQRPHEAGAIPGQSRPQKTPKGNRNQFIKAAKHGSQVRHI